MKAWIFQGILCLCEITTKAVSLESLKPPIYPSVNAFTYLSNVVKRDWSFVRHCR